MAIVGSIQEGNGSFDSELNPNPVNATTNAELTLILRVYLQQVPPGPINDTDGNQFTARAWTANAWQHWTQRYKRESEQFWSGKFWLVTPNHFSELDWPSTGRCAATHRPNIWCRLRIDVVNSAANSHTQIRVARLQVPQGQTFNAATFRSHAQLYDDHDLGTAVFAFGNHRYYHRTFVHEVGHSLGLPHIGVTTGNPACAAAGNNNAAVCYGTNHVERQNIMGFGQQLSLNEATPWLRRIARHTNTRQADWRAERRRVYPRLLTSIPGAAVCR